MRTTSEILNYLTRYYQQKNGQTTESLLPEKVSGLIGDMSDFLEKRLENDTPHKAIWDEFMSEPEYNAASLSGILEVLFEAQPAVRERVHGFMQAVTALESEQSDQEFVQSDVENSLQSEAGGLISDGAENSAILADSPSEKNPPAYLYGNEHARVQSDPQPPVSKSFQVGKNAQVVYIPTEKMKFPFMFMHLGKLSETSEDLNIAEKQTLQINLQEIRRQLMGEQPFDDSKMADALEAIWEVAPSYANALIESLQRNIDSLPVETQDFIIQLHSPLH